MENIIRVIGENWNLLWLMGMVITGFVLWHMTQRFVPRDEFNNAIKALAEQAKKQDEILSDLSTSILKLNTNIANMPNTTALHSVELSLADLRGMQQGMGAQLKGQSAVLERLSTNLDRIVFNKGKGAAHE